MRLTATPALRSALLALLVLGLAVGAPSAAAESPHNSSPPTITGTASAGQTLVGHNGSWIYSDGSACGSECSYAFRWQRCNTSGYACADVTADSPSQNYVVADADKGSTLRVVVTATKYDCNALNQDCRYVSSSATSSQTDVVPGGAPPPPPTSGPPGNTAYPTTSGVAKEGQTLTAAPGTWTNDPSYSWQWKRCDAKYEPCAPIPGATAQTYVVAAADIGSRVQVLVTATNASGSNSAASFPTDIVTGGPPGNSAYPTTTGTAQEGQTLTGNAGTWTSNPTSFAWQWKRCDASGEPCAPIDGATTQTYVLGADDVGSRVQVLVTAANATGSNSAASAPTEVVTGIPPVNTAPPVVSGTPWQGKRLTATQGTWTAHAPVTYAFRWERCDDTGTCEAIAGATRSAYVLAAADVGSTVRAVVTATHGGSPTDAHSDETRVVQAAAPTDGNRSLGIDDVFAPDRLVVSRVTFLPHVLRSHAPLTAKVLVKDARGFVVEGALVSVASADPGQIARSKPVQTGKSGVATLRLRPTARLRLGGGTVTLVVRAAAPDAPDVGARTRVELPLG